MDSVTVKTDVAVRCRCCMVPSAAAKDLSSEYEWMGEKEVYEEMLMESFDIKLKRVQTAGWTICDKCITRLRDSSNFKKQVLYAEKCLLQTLGGGSVADSSVHADPAEAKPDVMKFELGNDNEDNFDEFDTQYLDEDEDLDAVKEEVIVKFEVAPSTSEISKQYEFPPSSLSAAVKRKAPVKTVSDLTAKWPKLTIKPIKPGKRSNPIYSLSTPIQIKSDKAAAASEEKKATKKRTAKGVKSQVKTLNQPLKIKLKSSADATGKGRDVRAVIKTEPTKRRTVSTQHIPEGSSRDLSMKANCINILECSDIIPFEWNASTGFHCFYCGFPSRNTEALKLHMRDVHSEAKATKTVMKLKPDNFVKVDITTINCKFCPKHFVDVEALREHLEDEHKKTFHSEANLGVLPFRLADNAFVCAICQTELPTFHKLNDHVLEHFENYFCDKCEEGFMTYISYATHRSEHSGLVCPGIKAQKLDVPAPNELQCPRCPELFPDKVRRNQHCAQIHNVKGYTCDICDGDFFSKLKIGRHIRRVHLKEKNFMCEICSKVFFNRQRLDEHIRVHTGERPFTCTYCYQTYKLRSTLKLHLRIHKNDKRRVCAECGAAFVHNTSLRHHMKSHKKGQ